MIPRYTRPEMAAIWTEENKLAIWLRIEVLACEGRHKILREIPARDLAIIKRRAGFSIARCLEIEKRTNHDVIAFTTGDRRAALVSHRNRGVTP